MSEADEMRKRYKERTGLDWPFLISAEDIVKAGEDPNYGKFLLNTVGPALRKAAKKRAR